MVVELQIYALYRINKPIKMSDVMTLGMNAYRMEALQAKGEL